MSKQHSKAVLVAVWIIVVFGYLYLLQKIYDKQQSYYIFVLLALSGNLAYDGLKAVLAYSPLYPRDAALVVKYVAGFIASLAAAVASLFGAAALYHFRLVGDIAAQIIGGVGFLLSIAAGMALISSAERHFRLSNRA
jgi:hypothetical protein